MAVDDYRLLKRTSSVAQLNGPVSKKLNRGFIRHHKPTWDLQREQRLNSTVLYDVEVQSLLNRSIALALEAVGFEAATPEAIESFRNDVEKYMAHHLADVRQSMLSCRRTEPIPQDFLQALHTHQLSLRSLIPHLDPPVPPERSQFPLQSEPVQEDEYQQLRLLGPILNDTPNEQLKSYVPQHFPELPSSHTYKSTTDFPNRDVDPRKVRERATEEGRLGEEALRRLVGASSRTPATDSQQCQSLQNSRKRREQMFTETMAALTEGSTEAMEIDGGVEDGGKGKQKERDAVDQDFRSGRLHSAVNAEKRYWRTPAHRKATGTEDD